MTTPVLRTTPFPSLVAIVSATPAGSHRRAHGTHCALSGGNAATTPRNTPPLVEGIRDVTTAATCERTTSSWAGRRPVCDALPASTVRPIRTAGHSQGVPAAVATSTETADAG